VVVWCDGLVIGLYKGCINGLEYRTGYKGQITDTKKP